MCERSSQWREKLQLNQWPCCHRSCVYFTSPSGQDSFHCHKWTLNIILVHTYKSITYGIEVKEWINKWPVNYIVNYCGDDLCIMMSLQKGDLFSWPLMPLIPTQQQWKSRVYLYCISFWGLKTRDTHFNIRPDSLWVNMLTMKDMVLGLNPKVCWRWPLSWVFKQQRLLNSFTLWLRWLIGSTINHCSLDFFPSVWR